MGSLCRFGLIGLILIGLSLGSCAPRGDDPYRGWWLWYSVEDEKEVGEEASERIEEELGVLEGGQLVSYVNSVGQRVALYSDRKTINYEFGVLKNLQPNALALPGGYVYVTRGLLRELDNEAELAAVIGHEIAHVDAYHALKRRQGQVIGLATAIGLAPVTGGASLQAGLMGAGSVVRGYTRSAERQADDLGMSYAARAGYDPKGMVTFLKRLKELSNEVPDRELIMLRTHPYLADRIQTARADLPAKRRLVGSNPMLNRIRFRRNTRNALFTDEENQVLDRLDELIAAYQEVDVDRFENLLQENFTAELGSDTQSKQEFTKQIRDDLQGLERIVYDYRLIEVRAPEEDQQRVVIEFRMTEHPREGSPETTSGFQELLWSREDGTWMLKRLR